ncbi:MAG: nucleoside deaminase [Planctomycetes bacterium]|nr:nucleoside deaminase [Planctomycetota bacterium]
MHTTSDEQFLREAIRLSIEKMQAGEGGPFGAVVVRDGQIVGRGWNRVTSANDPTAHAEIVAIRAACRTLKTFRLNGCLLYSSCEPCPMCLAAIYWARIDSLWYAASRDDAARAGFDDAWIAEQIVRPPQEQSLSIRQALRDEAIAAFEAWLRKENRVEY